MWDSAKLYEPEYTIILTTYYRITQAAGLYNVYVQYLLFSKTGLFFKKKNK